MKKRLRKTHERKHSKSTSQPTFAKRLIFLLVTLLMISAVYTVYRSTTHIVKAVVTPVTLTPTADVHVRSDNAGANFAAATALEVDGSPLEVTYFKFAIPDTSGSTLISAKLRLYVVNNSRGPVAIKEVTDLTWSETAVTYTVRPALGNQITTFPGGSTGAWVEVDLTSYVASKTNQTISFALDETNSDGIHFSSREATTNKPQLVLQLDNVVAPSPTPTAVPDTAPTATPTSTPVVTNTPTNAPPPSVTPTPTTPPTSSGDPVIAAAGDMVGDLSVSPNSKHKEVSDIIVGMNPDAVLVLGDVVYENGEYANFINYYEPTWGRFINKTYPVVGNHEFQTTGAKGYFDYYTQKFGGEGNTTKRPGARTQGYYSFDIGTWHFVALNTQCSKAGGCGVGSPQERWLRADLAAHANQCTLAFWHIPLYSSGGRANSNSKALWQALYDFNADVVLTGHDHTYERFKPMDANGNLNTTRGLRSFVVGTGGKNHTTRANNAVNSEVFDEKNFGVLKMSLKPTSYDWEFIPLLPSVNNFVNEHGTGVCH